MPPRSPRAIWQHRFDLRPDDPDEAALHAYLDDLARDGRASYWIRETLLAALRDPAKRGILPKANNGSTPPEITYGEPEETA